MSNAFNARVSIDIGAGDSAIALPCALFVGVIMDMKSDFNSDNKPLTPLDADARGPEMRLAGTFDCVIALISYIDIMVIYYCIFNIE